MANIDSFWLGQIVRVQTTITSATDSTVKVEPGHLKWSLKEPDGTTVSYVRGTDAQLVSATVGVFYVDWPSAKDGLHRGGWLGTASNGGADEFSFNVLQRMY
mgnify:CR=1 FL=1